MSRRSIPTIVALACVGLSGCARDAIPETDRGVAFDPISFFEGRTHGEGELRKLFGKPVHVSVDSTGRPAPGGLILDQIIREERKQPSIRRWVIRRVAQNRYTGSLTEALGPVTAKVSGSRAEVQYRMHRGLNVEQQLTQQPDRHTVLNRLSVYKLGVRVATLREAITKSTR